MAVTQEQYGYKSSLTGNLYATQAGAQSAETAWIASHPSTSTSTTPNITSSAPAAAPAPTGSGGSGGSFTQYVKAPTSNTVYGQTSDGHWVAFESADQFTGSGGQWNQIKTVATAPSGAINYSQFHAPATNSPTGDPNLDALLGRLDQMIQDQAAAGNKFNPNIELTPDVVKQFLDQATAEIGPYYAGQINAIKDKLTTSLSNLQKNYDLNKQSAEATFKKNLSTTRENLAAGGAAYSGFRGQAEQNLTDTTNRSLEGLGLDTANSVNSAVDAARGAVGSSGLPTLPSISGYAASPAGSGSFTPTRSLNFTNYSAPLTGDLTYNQNRDISNLTDYLKQQEVNRRVLSF